MFISSEDLNDFVFISSLISVVVFLSLSLISYGLKMSRLTILFLVLLIISGITAVVQFE